MSFKIDTRIIITIVLCFTFLFAGWTAGSSLSYRKGYAEAERMQNLTQLDRTELSKDTEVLLKAARQARFDLLIRYKGEYTRDFLTLLSAHQKGSAIICQAYIQKSTDDALIKYCNETIIPEVRKNREFNQNYLTEKGLQ